MAAMSDLTSVAMLGYLLWIRKHFRGPVRPGVSSSVAESLQAQDPIELEQWTGTNSFSKR